MDKTNYYELLGINKNSSSDEIKKAALLKNENIKSALKILLNPARKLNYDENLNKDTKEEPQELFGKNSHYTKGTGMDNKKIPSKEKKANFTPPKQTEKYNEECFDETQLNPGILHKLSFEYAPPFKPRFFFLRSKILFYNILFWFLLIGSLPFLQFIFELSIAGEEWYTIKIFLVGCYIYFINHVSSKIQYYQLVMININIESNTRQAVKLLEYNLRRL